MRGSVLAALLYLTLALLIAGCGGADKTTTSTSTSGSAEVGQGDVLVAALGDSITAGSPGWDPDPSVRGSFGIGANEQSQYEYWAARRHLNLRFRNCGVLGQRTDQIAGRLESCAQGAKVLVIQGGINDIARGRPVSDAVHDLRVMVQTGKELGLRVALVDVLPWNNGYPEADRSIRMLNERIARIGREENVPVLPFHDTLEDPRRPGRMRARLTVDGDHPTIEGYRLLGERAFRLP